MSGFPTLARQMWHQIEPVHATIYYSPEAFEEAERLGYDVESRWPSYFAWRTAPLGAAGPKLVAATYYSFSPAMIAEYVPGVWATAQPGQVLQARLRAMDRTLRALLGDRIATPEIVEAAELAVRAAESVTVAHRPLAAANLDLPWPEEPHLALWQAYVVLREHRGDGHLAALATADLDACEALVSFAAVGAAPVGNFAGRGWTAEEWAAAHDRLATRGLLDADGAATPAGRALRDRVERTTDELAAGPWRALGAEAAERLALLNRPLLGAVFESGMLPAVSTLGIGSVRAPE
ncbi:SCO6745 family protein [Streptosporangium sp. CA-135522]|uniref:SCO6745 family protein n=1 Tax=Streptosporangium sp. CA-135522 TaxID=3240072 RepID=UPI003D921D45